MKEAATELLFGGHETTASTATSLVMFLGLNPEVIQRIRDELEEQVRFQLTNKFIETFVIIYSGMLMCWFFFFTTAGFKHVFVRKSS